ncbi:N-acetylgalactosamine kinase [Frankliniella fusca]|uniref:N-acetylgalactosamine kinase n=1 Tax=Frankliniella fusca TaxID=407009 RepID=A0AAE1HC99_9NEOP|nr:N-acetylgalactosamine kinase [Frankliniella fusca]
MGSNDTPSIVPLEQFKKTQLLNDLIAKFNESYGVPPTFIVCVPGRVNLIGEHIDYCGYSVLPMALEQHILIACKKSDDFMINLVNLNPKYPPYKGNISSLSFNRNDEVQWHNYVLCGIKGIVESSTEKTLHGMNLAIAGNVLPNSGLSSSSALVCAAALSTAYANKINFSKQHLASLCAKSERYIGTEGGGMDQAIAFLANKGCAKHISFKPLTAEDVKLPDGLAILVAHSFAELNKAASDHFNQRVAECRLASLVIAKQSSLQNWKELTVLADVQKELKISLADAILKTKEILVKEVYLKDEICEILGLKIEDLNNAYLPPNIWNSKYFKLNQRATHVFEEALRVSQFQDICKHGGSPKGLGHLMNLSHDSLRDLYECSHPQLDKLVSAARESGALGARLTGAGWGGCMVALTTEEHGDTLISSLKEKFYSSLNTGEMKNEPFVFRSLPGNGAVILQ